MRLVVAADGFVEASLPVFADAVDVVVVGCEVAMERVFVALAETFSDRSQRPRTRKHTKPSSKFDRPVERAVNVIKGLARHINYSKVDTQKHLFQPNKRKENKNLLN